MKTLETEIIEEMIEYIKLCEEQIDGEWGECRGFEQLLEAGEVPDLYFKLVELEASIK